jgi:2-dehydropantoate 2-reductase
VNIGIVGLGAIGGPIAARLLRSRAPGEVLALAAGSEKNAEALRQNGLRIEDTGGSFDVAAPPLIAPALPELDAPYDLILLCTRTDALEAAVKAAVQMLAPAGALVCVQNGLPEARAAAIVGPERTLGTVIGWSSSVDAPGRFRVTSEGKFTLGAFSEASEDKLDAARRVLQRAAPVKLTDNLPGARWSKLAINCAMSTIGTVAGMTLGEMAANAGARLLAMRVVGEVVEVARAHGVDLERVSGVDPSWVGEVPGGGPAALALRPVRHALIWAAAQPHRRQRSGMLARLEAGRPAGQIDDLNGAVARAARAVGRRAPVNERLTGLVHAIERGDERIGAHQIARVLSGT